MLINYIKMALRTLRKNKFSTVIQSFGLGVGLTVYLLAQVIVDHEQSYDTFFENHERIYSIYVRIDPAAGRTREGSCRNEPEC